MLITRPGLINGQDSPVLLLPHKKRYLRSLSNASSSLIQSNNPGKFEKSSRRTNSSVTRGNSRSHALSRKRTLSETDDIRPIREVVLPPKKRFLRNFKPKPPTDVQETTADPLNKPTTSDIENMNLQGPRKSRRTRRMPRYIHEHYDLN